MKRPSRLSVLLAILIGALALNQFGDQPGLVADAVPGLSGTHAGTPSRVNASGEAAAANMILPIIARAQSDDLPDIFAPHSFAATPQPTQPPQVASAARPVVAMPEPPPPARVAPPIPYTVHGKKLEDGRWDVFLSRQDRTYVARVTVVLDGTYRVEEIRPPNMILTYLPMNKRQTVAIGGFE